MNKKYLQNNFIFMPIKNKHLVTTNHGEWILLDNDEFKELKQDNITNKELFNKLEEKGIIITKKNKENIKLQLKERLNHITQGTSLHIIVVTLRCNLKCIYCHASSRSEEKKEFDMTKETAKKTLDFIFQSKTDYITLEFQGGEPLLNFEIIKEINEYSNELNKIYKKKLEKALVTNLSFMNEEILKYCIKNKISICTSLDGPKYLHDKNRCGKESNYEEVKNWIKKIQKNKQININALLTTTKESLKYPREIIDEYINQRLKSIHIRFMNKLGYANDNKKYIEYTPEEFVKFWKECIEYIIEINKKGTIFTERTIIIILHKILGSFDPNYLEMRNPCGAVIGQMAYNYNGDIYSCDEGRMLDEDLFKLGNVYVNNYKQIINSEKSCSIISSSINDTTTCIYCAFKPYCGLCPVCNYVEQKTTYAIIPETTFCKIYKEQFKYIFEKYLFDKDCQKIFENWLK
jgi:uncharacterized protein